MFATQIPFSVIAEQVFRLVESAECSCLCVQTDAALLGLTFGVVMNKSYEGSTFVRHTALKSMHFPLFAPPICPMAKAVQNRSPMQLLSHVSSVFPVKVPPSYGELIEQPVVAEVIPYVGVNWQACFNL